MTQTRELAVDLLEKAKKKGATAGDVLLLEGESFSVQVRLGSIDRLIGARERRLGLRLFFGRRSAVTSTSDLSPDSLSRLLEETCSLTQVTAPDEFSGLPSPDEVIQRFPDLDLWDHDVSTLSEEEKIRFAIRAEEAALEYDRRVTNSEGAEFSASSSDIFYVASHGFAGGYKGSWFSLSVVPVVTGEGQMQRDYWYSSSRKLCRVESPDSVGKKAAQRALRRLGSRKIDTCRVPVVFDPETASSLLAHLASALSGYALFKRASYLVGKKGEKIAPESVTIFDDGTIPQALGSRPFDGEGSPTRRTTIVEKGCLVSYLLDSYSGRKLGLPSTGNAVRGAGDVPSVGPTNFSLAPGPYSPEEILRSVKKGLYVTDLIGFGVNLVTGDYSRGASGVWIENGELAYPVEEVTIAGNLARVFADIEMVGNDLKLRRSISSPTLKIREMTVAGR